MKRTFLPLVMSTLAFVVLTSCASGPNPSTMGRLGWMAGCWQSADGSNRETWSAPQAGLMFGHATTTQGGQLAFFEQSRINLNSRPASYIVSPNGQRSVTFVENPDVPTLPEIPQIAFENAANEFPQRISYRSPSRNRLAATISQMDGSQSVQYSWTRCDS